MDQFSEFYNKFIEIAQEGDEEKLRNFLVENFNILPENIQRDILGLFFEEAVDRTYAEITGLSGYLSELLTTYKELEGIKRLLENKKRELELKEDLGL